MKTKTLNTVIILDFGSQYTQLITKVIRKLKVYSIILPCYSSIETIKEYQPKAIILSGGPSSVYSRYAPKYNSEIFTLNIPMLGICYGMQVIADHFKGKVEATTHSEYGNATIEILDDLDSFYVDLATSINVWMSHGDKVSTVPKGFKITAKTKNNIASFSSSEKKIYAIQFHPEVIHSKDGEKIISNFLFKIGNVKPDWKVTSLIDEMVKDIKEKVGSKKVILGLSGGVDSSVLAVLLHKAIGDQLLCVFIDNGLLRQDESKFIISNFRKSFNIPLKCIDASKVFLKKLRFVKDPERKRKIIGKLFIKIFAKFSKEFDFLAQGTLYTDVIESVSITGPSQTIKTHHNRVKEVLLLMKNGKVIEPFEKLFKDEVREIGKVLKVPSSIIERHPFPVPGLAIRILGFVTLSRLEIIRKADFILHEEINKSNLYSSIWQCFAVLLPIKSVGVVGDQRRYGYTIAIRAITSVDGMTADFYTFEKDFLTCISTRIVGEISEVTRVVLDITSKPPATVEWE